MNSKLLKILTISFLLLAVKSSVAKDGFSLTSSNQKWIGSDYYLSNNFIILKPDIPLIALRTQINFGKKTDYIIEVEYEWKGSPSERKVPFYIDFYVPGKWDGAEYNFVPDKKECANGIHKFKKIFNPLNAPDNLWIRIIKQTPAEIIIRKINIRPVKTSDALMLRIRKIKKFDPVIIWLLLQVISAFFVWILMIKKIKTETKKYKIKKYYFFITAALILILLIFIGLKLRYNYVVSKAVSVNLLKNKWKSVEMQGEDNNSKIVSISKAPEKFNGYYWLDVTIKIPSEVKENEEFIVDFFGEDFDTADTKIHIPISKSKQKSLARRALLYFDNPPSNLYIMVYSTYNSPIELKRLEIKKRPAFADILLFKTFNSKADSKAEKKKNRKSIPPAKKHIQIIPGNCDIKVDGVNFDNQSIVVPDNINKILFGIPVTLAQKKSYVLEVEFETLGKYAFDDSLWFDLYKPNSWNANFHNFIIPQYFIKNGKHKWSRAFFSDMIPKNATLRCYKKGNFEYKISHLSINLLTFKVLFLKLIAKPAISGVLIAWLVFGYFWIFVNKRLSKKYILKYIAWSLIVFLVIILLNIAETKLIYYWLKGILC